MMNYREYYEGALLDISFFLAQRAASRLFSGVFIDTMMFVSFPLGRSGEWSYGRYVGRGNFTYDLEELCITIFQTFRLTLVTAHSVQYVYHM